MRNQALVVVIMLVFLVGCAGSYDAKLVSPTEDQQASAGNLITIGSFLVVADFFVNSLIHEGSHAVAVAISGQEIKSFKPYPHMLGERLVFGSVKWISLDNKQTAKALIIISPKLVDITMLTLYTVAEETNFLPDNQYAQMALWVVAFGAWIDLVHDVCSDICWSNPNTDLAVFEKTTGLESYRWATRGTLILTSGLFAISLWNGLNKVFDPPKLEEDDDVSLLVAPNFVGFSVKF